MENYIAEGHSYYTARGTRERGKRGRLYLNLASLSDCFPRCLLLGEPKQKSDCERDRVMSSVAVNPPGHNTGQRRMQRKEPRVGEPVQGDLPLPFRDDWFYFSSLQLSKCRASTSRGSYDFVGSPGLWVEDLVYFRLCSLLESSLRIKYR